MLILGFHLKIVLHLRNAKTHINDEHVDNPVNLDIIMPMYNLIEYSDNYSDISWSLWQFKRDEQNLNNGNSANLLSTNQFISNH